MLKCSKQPNTEAFVLNIEKFDIRYCFACPAVGEFRVSTCPPLPDMPAHKVNALSGVGPDSGIYAALQQAGIRIFA
jgi:hypothetical protein